MTDEPRVTIALRVAPALKKALKRQAVSSGDGLNAYIVSILDAATKQPAPMEAQLGRKS